MEGIIIIFQESGLFYNECQEFKGFGFEKGWQWLLEEGIKNVLDYVTASKCVFVEAIYKSRESKDLRVKLLGKKVPVRVHQFEDNRI